MLHGSIAAASKTPELAIDPEEAKRLSEAAHNVYALYDLPGISPRAEAWMALAFVAGSLYVPRALQIKARLDDEAKEKRKQKEAAKNQVNVVSMGLGSFG